MDLKFWVDLLGWIGSIEVILAYFLISNQKLTGRSTVFQMLNLTGALFLILNTVYYQAYPSTFINVVWVFIAISGLISGKKNAVQ